MLGLDIDCTCIIVAYSSFRQHHRHDGAWLLLGTCCYGVSAADLCKNHLALQTVASGVLGYLWCILEFV
jgi:hypothetical protein